MARTREIGHMEIYGGEGEGAIVAGLFHQSDRYETVRPRGRSDWLMVFTLGGSGYFRTAEGERRCEAGDAALMRPGVPQRYGTCPGETWHFVWAHFPGDRVEAGLLPDGEMNVVRIASHGERRRLYRALLRVVEDARVQGPFWDELCLASLREALALTARCGGRGSDPRAAEALRWLAAHMREEVRVETVAEAVGLSPSRLSHLFKATTGQSIIDALNAMRIRHAAMLLEMTALGAAEIAYEAGFRNYNHFLQQFRKRYGMSPSGYRRRGGTAKSGGP